MAACLCLSQAKFLHVIRTVFYHSGRHATGGLKEPQCSLLDVPKKSPSALV